VIADGDEMWKGSGFVAEFDETSMIGTVFSSATVARRDSCFPSIEKVICSDLINLLNCSFDFWRECNFLVCIILIVDKSISI
jgi:hypothetical protein